MFQNKVLRKIFGPKRDEIIRDWRKLHNEELHNMYASANTIRMTMEDVMCRTRGTRKR
jgi:hypothetical protein